MEFTIAFCVFIFFFLARKCSESVEWFHFISRIFYYILHPGVPFSVHLKLRVEITCIMGLLFYIHIVCVLYFFKEEIEYWNSSFQITVELFS